MGKIFLYPPRGVGDGKIRPIYEWVGLGAVDEGLNIILTHS